MKPADAVEAVKKELEGLFGKGLMGGIMITARKNSSCPIMGITVEHFLKLIDAICRDSRVTGMLGAAGARQKLIKWKSLI